MARYTRLQVNDIHEIVRNYNLVMVDFAPIEGGAANSSYVIRTRQGQYVLTVFDDKTLADVVSLGQLLLLLAEYDFPTTRLLAPAQGNIAIVHRGKPVILKPYISGRVCRTLDNVMLHQIGAAMARLHQIPAPDFIPDEHSYGLRLFSAVIGRQINLKYESWLARQLRYFEQHIPQKVPRGLIHGDLFYDNVLVEGSLKAIIDFEEACYYYKAFDLGMAIVGLCTEATKLSLSKARALTMGYQHVRSMEEEEEESLQLFVEYAATATSYWRFWKYHIDTPQTKKADKHWQMVRLAKEVRAIPKASFFSDVFSH